MTNQLTNYIPGVCNINPVEIRRRRQAGHIGLVLSVVVIVGLIALHAPWYLRARYSFFSGGANAVITSRPDKHRYFRQSGR